MKKFFFTVLFVCLAFSLSAADKQKLPPLDSLKELPLKKIADFMDHDDIATSALPIISTSGDLFFFDSKHKQLFKTHLDNQKLTPISRFGEGPKEYTWILNMMYHESHLYSIDMKRKILCFDKNGGYKWERRIRDNFGLSIRLLAKIGDTFFFRNSPLGPVDKNTGIFRLNKDAGKFELIYELPRLMGQINSIINGKEVKGGGFISLAEPVFLITGDKIISSASNNFQLNILDLKGKTLSMVTLEVPEGKPVRNKIHQMVSPKTEPYAIKEIYNAGKYIAVVSNYFKDEKPRVDFFTIDGTLEKSYLLPFKTMNSPLPTYSISGKYLMHTDRNEVGFTIYEIQ